MLNFCLEISRLSFLPLFRDLCTFTIVTFNLFICRQVLHFCGDVQMRLAQSRVKYEVFVEEQVIAPLEELADVCFDQLNVIQYL